MRILLLLLVAWPAFAGPITFTFEGTWDFATPEGVGLGVRIGAPVQGSFTFERTGPELGDVAGELAFSIGSLVFDPTNFWEDEFGRGHMRGITQELACDTRFGALPCMVHATFRENHLGNWIGIGAVSDEFSIWSLAASSNIVVDPYMPFTVPEPATLVLVGTGLLLICIKIRRS